MGPLNVAMLGRARKEVYFSDINMKGGEKEDGEKEREKERERKRKESRKRKYDTMSPPQGPKVKCARRQTDMKLAQRDRLR